METITTDVLIIGAGAAGIRAALAASEAGADVVMVAKAPPTEGGSTFSPVSKGWGIQALMGDERTEENLEAFYDDIMRVGLGRCDPTLVRVLVEESGPRLADLMSYGLRFRKDGDGRYVRVAGCFSTYQRAFVTESMANIADTFKSVLKRSHVKTVVGETVDLAIADGACWGAWVFTDAGEMVQVTARATILATGGGAGIFEDHLVSDDLVGDGYALAYRAGAELVNVEFIQFMLGLKAGGTRQFLPLSRLGVGGLLEDTQGRNVLEGFCQDAKMLARAVEERKTHFPFSCRDRSLLVDIAVAAERRHGRSVRWTHRLGSEPSDIPEVVHFAHAFNGGAVIDDRAETTVPGLFAAGEVAAGPHGADRIGGCMMTATQVFGERTGRFAARKARQPGQRQIPEVRLPQELQGVSPSKHSGPEGLSGIEHAIRQTMADCLGIVRTKEAMDMCRTRLDNFNKMVHGSRFEEGLVTSSYFKVRNMVRTAALVTDLALLREQSLGSHYRHNFPPGLPPMMPTA